MGWRNKPGVPEGAPCSKKLQHNTDGFQLLGKV